MTIDLDWVSGTYLRMEIPVSDEEGDQVQIPKVFLRDRLFTLGHFASSSPFLQINPSIMPDGTTLLVEVPSGTDLPPGLYAYQIFLTIDSKKMRIRRGTIRVLPAPPTET